MTNILSQNLFFLLAGFSLFFLLIVFFVSRKSASPPKIFHDTLFLEVSSNFKKEAEAILKSEVEAVGKQLRESLQSSSFELISNYQREVEKLTREVALLSPEFKNALNKKLDSAMLNIFEEIKKSLLGIEKTNREVSQSILAMSQKKIEELEKQIKEISRDLKTNLEKKQSEIDNFLENYKKEKLKEIDERIFQIISEVAIKTLGKTLDLSAHEELVIRSLEKAKREKFF